MDNASNLSIFDFINSNPLIGVLGLIATFYALWNLITDIISYFKQKKILQKFKNRIVIRLSIIVIYIFISMYLYEIEYFKDWSRITMPNSSWWIIHISILFILLFDLAIHFLVRVKYGQMFIIRLLMFNGHKYLREYANKASEIDIRSLKNPCLKMTHILMKIVSSHHESIKSLAEYQINNQKPNNLHQSYIKSIKEVIRISLSNINGLIQNI
ncbi:hypothetical protein ACFL6G_09430 [candidate division KSB1 bacterium]